MKIFDYYLDFGFQGKKIIPEKLKFNLNILNYAGIFIKNLRKNHLFPIIIIIQKIGIGFHSR